MRAAFFILALMAGSLVSCTNEELADTNTCLVNNPVEDLEWLRSSIAEMEGNKDELYPYTYISQAVFNHQTVFIFNNCCPFCNTTTAVLNCEGTFLFNRYEEGRGDALAGETVIWQAEGCECNFL